MQRPARPHRIAAHWTPADWEEEGGRAYDRLAIAARRRPSWLAPQQCRRRPANPYGIPDRVTK
jgi:hypothetical protein